MERERKPGRSVEAKSCAPKEGCAKLSTWDKIVTTDNPFTLVRRLCVGGSEKNADAYNFDLFDLTAQDYDISIGFMREETQVSPERYRWIPNTGEYLVLSKIQLNCYNRLGIPVPLGYDKYVVLNGAVDRDYNANDTNGNLYNNRASNFDVKIFSSSNEKFSGLMKKSSSDEKSYVIVEDAAKSNYIEIDQNGYLVDASSKKLISIGIRPENAANAFPGDDLRLDFSVCKYIGGSLFATLKESLLTKETDYIAVYDKKMLWRANLYTIQEEEKLGGIDWNNAHPWAVPEKDGSSVAAPVWWDAELWGYNDWSNLGGEVGKQQPIVGWTRWIDSASSLHNMNEMKTISYAWGSFDSFDKYNEYLRKEKNLIQEKRDLLASQNQNNQSQSSQSSIPSYETLSWNISEEEVYAPGNSWFNYLFTNRKVVNFYDYEIGANKDGFEYGSLQQNVVQHKYLNGNTKTYVPGLATYLRYGNQFNVDHTYLKINGIAVNCYKPSQASNNYSIGVDCSGFVCAAIYYDKTTYKASASLTKKGCGDFANDDNSIMISKNRDWGYSSDDPNPNEKKEDIEILKHAVPGVVLVKTSPGAHIVIIKDINEDIYSFSDVEIIHAAQGDESYENSWCVFIGNWKDASYGDHPAETYRLRRLKR